MRKLTCTLCAVEWFLCWFLAPAESESSDRVALQQIMGKARDLGSCGSSYASKTAGRFTHALMVENDQRMSKHELMEFLLLKPHCKKLVWKQSEHSICVKFRPGKQCCLL